MPRKRTITKERELDNYNSYMGKIIDLPLEQFKEELVKQKVNVGTMNNLIIHLTSVYYDLKKRKDDIISSTINGRFRREDTDSVIKGIYVEMARIEEKVTYLKELTKTLINAVD